MKNVIELLEKEKNDSIWKVRIAKEVLEKIDVPKKSKEQCNDYINRLPTLILEIEQAITILKTHKTDI